MSRMKDSGIEWIGNIPEEWLLKRIKYSLLMPITDGPHETPEFIMEGIPFLSVDSIQNNTIIMENPRYISKFDAKKYDKKCKPRNGDILMGKAASVGKIAIVETDERFQIWSPLALIRSNNNVLYNYFLKFFLESDCGQKYIESLSTMNTQKNISMSDIEKIKVIMPNIIEQNLIADFLLKKTIKISNILSDLNKQMEILNRYKKSLITETVTKGLNKNVVMKDSEIEWIGRIPEEWTLKRIKYNLLIPITDGPHETPEFIMEGIPFLSVDSIQNNKIVMEKLRYISKSDTKKYDKKCKPQKGDILIGKAASIGKIAIVETDERFQIWSPLALIRSNNSVLCNYFLKFFLESNCGQEYIESLSTMNTQKNIAMNDIEKIKIIMPPLDEQKQIVEYLNSKCEQIDKILEEKQKQVEIMEEYKKSVIFEYVTGKKRVKGAEELYVN